MQTTSEATTWWQRAHGGDERELLVAYFSMEFGLHERLPIYSGGLGVLAGDHLKAAAELGVPLVGVGLLYRGGYFRQGVDAAGRQTEDYQPVDPEAVGVTREPVSVSVDLAGETIEAAVWRKEVGSVTLYLLEVDWLTDALYGGDREHRIRQELLLGVGGVRALAALGIEPTVFHLNEGHSAFLQIERVRALVEQGLETDDALEQVRASSVFTTHTPVPAGNEVFDEELVVRVRRPARRRGRSRPGRSARARQVRRQARLRPDAARAAPVGVRQRRLAAPRGGRARDVGAALAGAGDADRPRHERRPPRHLARPGPRPSCCAPRASGRRRRPDEANWDAARHLDPETLWHVHAAAKARLAERAGIDRDRLTIGFARRFATYKRAGLVFSDLERLLALPVQIVVAGKAHPADDPGKDVMQGIVELARDPRRRGRASSSSRTTTSVLARTLVRGCDVWLNTPTRPLEASGTSGMKAAANGVLNLSVLDGWWAEAYAPELGWAIEGASDDADREQLYRLLEERGRAALRGPARASGSR